MMHRRGTLVRALTVLRVPDSATTLWLVDLDACDPAGVSLLDAGERSRMQRLRTGLLQGRFAARRAALRQLLGACVGIDPAGLRLGTDETGKPALRCGSLQFNLSSSGAWAAIAVNRQAAVGVDLEVVTPQRDPQPLVEAILTPGEQAWLAPWQCRTEALYWAWTRKEACLKAAGCGLRVDPRTVDVRGANGFVPALQTDESGVTFRLHSMSPRPGLRLALAVGRARPGARQHQPIPKPT